MKNTEQILENNNVKPTATFKKTNRTIIRLHGKSLKSRYGMSFHT